MRVAVRQIYPMDLATTQEGMSSAVVPALTREGKPAAVAVAEGSCVIDGGDEGRNMEGGGGAFVNGLPLEVGVRRMSEWLQRAAMATAAPPLGNMGKDEKENSNKDVVPAGGGVDEILSRTAATTGVASVVQGGSEGKAKNGESSERNGKKQGGGGRSKKAKKSTLKQALMQKGSGVSVYGPSVLDHCVLGAGLRPNTKLTASGNGDVTAGQSSGSSGGGGGGGGGLSEGDVRKLVVALAGAEATVQQLDRPGQQGYIQCKLLPLPTNTSSPGTSSSAGGGGSSGNSSGSTGTAVIVAKQHESSVGRKGAGDVDSSVSEEATEGKKKEEGGGGREEDDGDGVVYEEFLPQVLAQHEGTVVHSFPSFDQAVDSFFGRIVEQKLKQVSVVWGKYLGSVLVWYEGMLGRRY